MIMACTNAVNLTDGLDGLAAGSSIFAFACFTVIGFWAFRNPGVYQVDHALDLAVVAAAMLGGCAGFLWWNAHPGPDLHGRHRLARHRRGAGRPGLTTQHVLLLPIIGGLFVVETLSVIIQVATFRVFGRRVFRMAPIHHHFELRGWPETTVIVRFWILAGLSTAWRSASSTPTSRRCPRCPSSSHDRSRRAHRRSSRTGRWSWASASPAGGGRGPGAAGVAS